MRQSADKTATIPVTTIAERAVNLACCKSHVYGRPLFLLPRTRYTSYGWLVVERQANVASSPVRKRIMSLRSSEHKWRTVTGSDRSQTHI